MTTTERRTTLRRIAFKAQALLGSRSGAMSPRHVPWYATSPDPDDQWRRAPRPAVPHPRLMPDWQCECVHTLGLVVVSLLLCDWLAWTGWFAGIPWISGAWAQGLLRLDGSLFAPLWAWLARHHRVILGFLGLMLLYGIIEGSQDRRTPPA